jgi:hypothetical protein
VCRQRSISCSSALKNLSSPASVPAWALLFFSPIHVFAAWLHFWHRLICCSIVPHVNNARFPLSVCVVLDFCCPGVILGSLGRLIFSLFMPPFWSRFICAVGSLVPDSVPHTLFSYASSSFHRQIQSTCFQRWRGRVCVA